MDEDAQAELAAYRHTIDNLDAAVIHMLAERFRCTKQVGELKSRHGMPPADPVREAQQLERMRALAVGAGPRLRREVPALRPRRGHPAPRGDLRRIGLEAITAVLCGARRARASDARSSTARRAAGGPQAESGYKAAATRTRGRKTGDSPAAGRIASL